MKDWTILIYANGNNEMEPEMYESMLSCKKIGSNHNVNVVVEIGRADERITNLMRPNEKIPKQIDRWTGTRRYYISKSNAIFIQDLGKINMADPNNLYKFLKWGIESYPAKHYMVMLGGHGISFIGNMTDLTYDVPYMMGTPEMCKALELITLDLDTKIDILVLDMCYMNSIEIIYELGKESNNKIENMLTYIDEGPFKGLPYDSIVSIVEKHSHIEDSKELIIKLINNLNLDMVAFELHYDKLENIKNKFSELAYCYLKNNHKYQIEAHNLLNSSDKCYPWHHIINELTNLLKNIIIHYKQTTNDEKSLIKVTSENIGNLITLYYKLSFSKNNYWTHLLCNKNPPKNSDQYIKFDLKPMKLAEKGILYSILTTNPDLTEDEAELILKQIFIDEK